jgi:hypothetical protein
MPTLKRASCITALLAASIAAPAAAAEEPAGKETASLESTRSTLARWMETQQIISREKKDWQTARDLLEQRIALLEGEIAAQESRLAEARETAGGVDSKRRELLAENAALKAATATLVKSIAGLEERTLRLLNSLPEPLLEKVAPLSRRIPRDPSSTEVSLGERFQNVIGILNEVNKFNREVSVASEIRMLPGGETAEVKVLYLGLGQAYFVTSGGALAGVGRPSAEGWEWSQADELSGRIAQAIAILQAEQVPAFVPLPVEIR